MRSVNLIIKNTLPLASWQAPLESRFSRVWIEYSAALAAREGLPDGVPNKLGIEDGDGHVLLLERPTSIREYEPEEIDALREQVGEPTQFFAVDYTDELLLRRVLAALLRHEGATKILVDDDGSLAALEDFLRQ